MYLILEVISTCSHLLTLMQMIKENRWSLGRGAPHTSNTHTHTHTYTHTHPHTHTQNIYIYIVFALQGNFSGFTKGYVIGSKRQNVYEEIAFSFLFTSELLYSSNIQSWDGTFLQLRKGSWDLLNCILSFLDIVIKKYYDETLCVFIFCQAWTEQWVRGSYKLEHSVPPGERFEEDF